MALEEEEAELDALLQALARPEADGEYPLPEKQPIKYTNVDVVVLPRGYKSEYPKPEQKDEDATAENDSIAQFTDSFALKLDEATEEDGTLRVPATIAHSKHVYGYNDGAIKAVKPFSELEAAARFANGIPITRDHPKAGIVTMRDQVLGFLRDPRAESDVLTGILEISDKDLIADIKEQKLSDVSPGYFCTLDTSDEAHGSLGDGKDYNAVQREIFLNHVAVCAEGRCSSRDGCGLNIVPTNESAEQPAERTEQTDHSAAVQQLQEAKDAVVRLKRERAEAVAQRDEAAAQRDALQRKLDELVQCEKDALVAELTTLQDTKTEKDLQALDLDALSKELDMVKGLRTARLAAPVSPEAKGRARIDEVYGKIGGTG